MMIFEHSLHILCYMCENVFKVLHLAKLFIPFANFHIASCYNHELQYILLGLNLIKPTQMCITLKRQKNMYVFLDAFGCVSTSICTCRDWKVSLLLCITEVEAQGDWMEH